MRACLLASYPTAEHPPPAEQSSLLTTEPCLTRHCVRRALRRAKKTENRASTAAAARAEDDGEAQRALQQLAEKVERNRQDVLQRMEEVQGLAKAIKDEVARLGK